MDIRAADWVRSKSSGMEGIVIRCAKDKSWVDVNWGAWSKRVRDPSSLEVLHTIRRGGMVITDCNRRDELEADHA